jgi:hypothetical protein
VSGGPQTFEEALDALRSGELYFDVHTSANADGEIRGQILCRVAATPRPTGSRAPADTSTEGVVGNGEPPTSNLVLVLVAVSAFVVAFGSVSRSLGPAILPPWDRRARAPLVWMRSGAVRPRSAGAVRLSRRGRRRRIGWQ